MLLELMKERNCALLRGDLSSASILSIKISQLSDSMNFLDLYDKPEDLLYIRNSFLHYSKYKKSIPAKELARSGQFFEIVFDSIIGSSWNLDRDVVYLDPTLFDREKFEEFLIKVGQKRYFFLPSDRDIVEQSFGSTLSPALAVEKLGIILPERVEFFINPERDQGGYFEKEIRDRLAELKISRNTIKRFEGVWLENIISGVSSYHKCLCASKLKQVISGRNVLVISPGPSLSKCADELRAKRNNFIFLAVAQAVPALNAMNITPDYVMVVDPTDYSNVLDGLDYDNVEGLIAYEAVHKNFLASAFRRTYIISPSSSPIENYRLLGGRPVDLMGGSVSVNACSLAITFGARVVGVIGQDLCLPGGAQYSADSADKKSLVGGRLVKDEFGNPYLQSLKDGSLRELYVVSGREGEDLLTPPDYYHYRMQLQEIADFAIRESDIQLINFSVGGSQIDGFENMDMSQFSGIHQEEVIFDFGYCSNYLNDLKELIDIRIERNRRFLSQYDDFDPCKESLVVEFLSIPSIRFFGGGELIDFFSNFDNSTTESALLENSENLKVVMRDMLSAHFAFYLKLRREVDLLL